MQKSEKCKQIHLISFVNSFNFNIFDIYGCSTTYWFPHRKVYYHFRHAADDIQIPSGKRPLLCYPAVN
jgi:hypothetical protein